MSTLRKKSERIISCVNTEVPSHRCNGQGFTSDGRGISEAVAPHLLSYPPPFPVPQLKIKSHPSSCGNSPHLTCKFPREGTAAGERRGNSCPAPRSRGSAGLRGAPRGPSGPGCRRVPQRGAALGAVAPRWGRWAPLGGCLRAGAGGGRGVRPGPAAGSGTGRPRRTAADERRPGRALPTAAPRPPRRVPERRPLPPAAAGQAERGRLAPHMGRTAPPWGPTAHPPTPPPPRVPARSAQHSWAPLILQELWNPTVFLGCCSSHGNPGILPVPQHPGEPTASLGSRSIPQHPWGPRASHGIPGIPQRPMAALTSMRLRTAATTARKHPVGS